MTDVAKINKFVTIHLSPSSTLGDMSQVMSGRPWAAVALPGIIKRTTKNPTPASVHKLRTTIRRLETLLASRGAESENKKLIKQIARIRKSAGQVRDVDVHLDILRGLDRRGVSTDYAELKNDLTRRRARREKKLGQQLEKQLDAGVVKRLKQLGTARADSAAEATVSVAELADQFVKQTGPLPGESALHHFRLTCKHLRYSAELAEESRERDTFISEMKKVQDAIGAWHDVLTLRVTAEDLLGTTRPIISLLRTLAQARLNEAQRNIAKSVAVIRRTVALPSGRKPVPSHVVNIQRTAATA